MPTGIYTRKDQARLCKKCGEPVITKAQALPVCDKCKSIKKPKKEKKKVFCVICNKEVLKHQRKTCSRECFAELNRRISVENYKSGKFKILTGNVGVKGHYYKDLYLRSSWELEFAKYLDSLGIVYEYEKTRIDLKDCTYTPDFYIPSFKMYVEIKGWVKDTFLKKMDKLDKLYPELNLLVINRPPPYNWVFW